MMQGDVTPYFNAQAKNYRCQAPSYPPALKSLHHALPTYATTPLHKLPQEVADSLNLDSIYLKDESTRFGLPSFKILGASWAVYCAICHTLDVILDDGPNDKLPIDLDELSKRAKEARIRLVLATDGNWGRAVAFTARLLGVKATVYVPEYVDEATRNFIADEGAEVRVFRGDYDEAILAAQREAAEQQSENTLQQERKLLVMDTSWKGYEQIPRWVTQGYGTMLTEVDEVFSSSASQPNLVVVSVGVGSWAHAVVQHYKSMPVDKRPLVVTVEPTSAPSLLISLHGDRITPITTKPTIMAGMNCGTTSEIAWPFLREGVDLALSVSDVESHKAVVELRQKCGVECGPCGAAPYAALKQIMTNGLLEKEGFGGQNKMSRPKSVLLFSTEGYRDYEPPA